ncbi:MAG: glutathione S-transferase N-terminal domain-containing protein [Acidithiobacillus sp.]|nr:glutathione S-transferase N-terminal domain-containing protein [Acidithiobacillus sp.]
MRLYVTPTSPYARKVRIALMEKGLAFALEKVDLRDPEHGARQWNPLGKIPVLVTNAGEAFFDSAVILQYLETSHPQPPLLPADPMAKLSCLRLEALANGIMDATVAWVQEQRRSKDCQDPALLQKLRNKTQTALAYLEEQSRHWQAPKPKEPLPLGQIGAVAAIGYVDLRAPELLVPYPDLQHWFQSLRDRPSVAQTMPE